MRNILNAIVVSISMTTAIFASEIRSLDAIGADNGKRNYRSLIAEAVANTHALNPEEKASINTFVSKVATAGQSYCASTGYEGKDHPWYAESQFYKSKIWTVCSYNFSGDNGSMYQDLRNALFWIDNVGDHLIKNGLIKQ